MESDGGKLLILGIHLIFRSLVECFNPIVYILSQCLITADIVYGFDNKLLSRLARAVKN